LSTYKFVVCAQTDGSTSQAFEAFVAPNGHAVVNLSGIRVDPADFSSGSATNLYGLNIEDQIGATNSWAIKTGAGKVEFGDTLQLDRNLITTLHTPASSSEPCTTGQIADDANHHYVCTATNTWKRVALSSF
jgi:hypothetical protein